MRERSVTSSRLLRSHEQRVYGDGAPDMGARRACGAELAPIRPETLAFEPTVFTMRNACLSPAIRSIRSAG
jgi:hypothetical protein